MQSELLTKFYRNYNDWLEQGAPDFKPFHRNRGLCWNLFYVNGPDKDYRSIRVLDEEIKAQFLAAGLCELTPFNDDSYALESDNHQCHTNEKRIQWVKDHINAGDEK